MGKSTLFNALTRSKVDAANYPFCTIEPNKGIVSVKDSRLDDISKIVKPKQIVPTIMEFVDIAGLVSGASRGEGLGNKFLANIRETQAIAHVVRCFKNNNITHVSGGIDPKKDIETINTELILSDIETVDRALNKVLKQVKSGSKEALGMKDFLERVKEHLNLDKPVRTFKVSGDAYKEMLNQLHLLTAKPVLYIANINDDFKDSNECFDQVKKIADNENAKCIFISASLESEIAEFDETEKEEFLSELNLKESSLDKVVRAGYDLLNLRTFFTAGPKEVRAWTFKKGCNAQQASGIIHSDIQKGFIKAEVVSFCDFIHYGGEQEAKEAGRLRLEGKEYELQDGDIAHFRFNV